MSVRAIPLADLCVSPFNVRSNAEDALATDALEASIAERGLLLPLIVHPMAPFEAAPRAPWGVLAGGRRLRAIRALAARGILAQDHAIDCVVRDLDAAEITELSLAENLLRRELRPYEVHAAIARAREQGASIAEIAANLGQREAWVAQQLRLGRLAPGIFAAYAEGTLSVEQARAYAATEDQALQRAAFAYFAPLAAWEHTEARIRAFLKVGDRDLSRLLAFVGEDVYRAAGGRFELDLFAEGPPGSEWERGRVVDEGTLRELAENKLAELRQRLRRRTGRSDLRFLAGPPQRHGLVDWHLQARGLEVPDDADRRHGRAEDIGAVDHEDSWMTSEASIELPDGEIAATLDIDDAGVPVLRWWWPSRAAKRAGAKETGGEERAARTSAAMEAAIAETGAAFDRYSGAAQAARAAVRDEHGLTADGLQVARSLRRELLRALLVGHAVGGSTLARDYLTWAQLRQELGKACPPSAGARGLASEWNGSEDAAPRDLVGPYLEDAAAHAAWTSAVAAVMREQWMTIEDPAASLAAFLDAPPATRDLAGAVLAGLALMRSANVDGWRVAAHDELAARAGGTDSALRQLWQPTPAFAALFPKFKRLELAQPFVDPYAFAGWHKLKDAVLTGACAGALEAAPGWVHPLLSFNDGREAGSLADVFARAEAKKAPARKRRTAREASA